jgi:hypothetical protein
MRWSFAMTMPGTLPLDTFPHIQTIGILLTESFHLLPLNSSPSCEKRQLASSGTFNSAPGSNKDQRPKIDRTWVNQ